MATEPANHLNLDVAHILYIDLVGYSLLPMEEQAQAQRRLFGAVRETPEFRRADSSGELVCLSEGDAVALVFFRDPAAPVRCSLEIARSLRRTPDFGWRMGIHTGPVVRVADINANADVAGGGINLAERVMDSGDPGHILISSASAELLQQIGGWSDHLHDLGECRAKHGILLHLFNLVEGDLGKPDRPSRWRAPDSPDPGMPARPAADPERADPRPATDGEWDSPAAPGAKLRVVLLYKRSVRPDERVLQLLEDRLSEGGCRVFIDRHMAIGVEWARTIERRIQTADAVIPLLSEASIASEMLAYEIQIARDAADRQEGRPRLLPVRIAYTGPLPEEIGAILDPLNYALWEGPQHDECLVASLRHALEHPSKPTSFAHADREEIPRDAVFPGTLEPVGGAVPIDSAFYIVRPADDEFVTALDRRDHVILIKGARQMGKTSMLTRGLHRAQGSGARVILTDFQKLNAAQLVSVDAFFLAMAEWIGDLLDLDVDPREKWNPLRGASVNFERFLRREVLGRNEPHLVWGLDEVDRLFASDFSGEVFGLFRSWHNERALYPSGPWGSLTMAIAYATEAHLFITDMNQSPFNIGTRLSLDDFTLDRVIDLNRRYGSPLRDDEEAFRYHRLVGGHPYLVRRGLYEMVNRRLEVAVLEAQSDRDEGIFGDHLRRILVLLTRNAALCEAIRAVLRGQPCPDATSFFHLRSAGLVAGDSPRDARLRCDLYARYLDRHLL